MHLTTQIPATLRRLANLKWVQAFEGKAASLNRLVLSFGSEWWQQYLYASAPNGCGTPGGISDAYKPVTSLGLGNHVFETLWRGCDTFEVK